MPNQAPKPTGARKPQTTDPQEENQVRKLPSIRADVYWLNPKEDENIRASASLTIGDAFAVHGIHVKKGQNGEFVSMPSYKKGDEYKNVFHAVTKEARDAMNDAVMKAYEQKLAEQDQGEEISEDDNLTDGEAEEAPGDDPDEEEGQVMDGM